MDVPRPRLVTPIDEIPGQLASNWLDRDHRARLICTDTRRLIWSNAAANEAFSAARDLRIDGNILEAASPANQAALNSFVAHCGTELTSCAMLCDDDDGYLLIRGYEIGRQCSHRFYGIAFHSSGSDGCVNCCALNVAFGLTHAETGVPIELAQGRTVDEIARSSQLSVSTVRCPIRNIYTKLEMNSREGLFCRTSRDREL